MGVHFTVYMDHFSLRCLTNISDPSGRLVWWRLPLIENDVDVIYKKGAQNTQTEALSRLPTDGQALTMEEDETPCFMVDYTTPEAPESPDPNWPERWECDAEVHELLTSTETPTENPVPGKFGTIQPEEMAREKFANPFCGNKRARLNGGETLLFELNDVSYLVRTAEATS